MDDALHTIITMPLGPPPAPVLPPTSSHRIGRAAPLGLAQETPPSSGEVDLESPPFPVRIGSFDVLRPLAQGGMGMVYLAHDPRLNRLVAVKVLRHHGAKPEDIARLRAEAEAVARLRHPHIVQIHEVGEQDGMPFLVLEYVNGGSLAQRLKGQPLPPRAAAQILLLLAQAMAHAHQVGILHRDLKPANVLLQQADADGPQPPLEQMIPKITDFGLARVPGHPGQTHSGIIVGTLHYMAPEQASGLTDEYAPTMDVYALGVMLYEMLTGTLPFLSVDPMALLDRIRQQMPLSPSRLQPSLPKDLVTICLKCLGKRPRERYATATALADDLQRFLDGAPIQARPVSRLEAAWKWARRFPAKAALIGVSFVAGLALLVACMIAYHNAALTDAYNDLQRALWDAQAQRQRAELAEFFNVAENHLDALQKSLYGHLMIAHALNDYVQSQPAISVAPFQRFAQATVDHHDELRAVEWLPRVPDRERGLFETQMRQSGPAPFQIRERATHGGLQPARRRPEYFPVLFHASHAPDANALGLDHAAVPAQMQAMARARDTGQPIATGLSEPGHPSACWVYLPVYTPEVRLRSMEERRLHLRGYIAVLIDMPKLLHMAWATVDGHARCEVTVMDISDDVPEVICHEGGEATGQTAAPQHLRQNLLTRQPHWAREFALLGRTWWICCLPATPL